MARRSIWKGAISFGMVAIPVKLYTATENKDLSFVTLHTTCNTRLKQRRYCPHHDVEVGQNETARAYEYSKDQYVVMQDSDFDEVSVPSTHTIEITEFVDLSQIDPINYERTYIIEPEGVGLKPFALLKQALESTGRVGIAKVSLRQKEHLCLLRPFGESLAMETMFYPDEIRGTQELDLPSVENMVTKQELEMAVTLIDQLTGSYEPDKYTDQYRFVLERIIESRLGTGEPVTAAPAAPKGKVTDLMEALKASIAATKGQRKKASDTADSRPKKRTKVKTG